MLWEYTLQLVSWTVLAITLSQQEQAGNCNLRFLTSSLSPFSEASIIGEHICPFTIQA